MDRNLDSISFTHKADLIIQYVASGTALLVGGLGARYLAEKAGADPAIMASCLDVIVGGGLGLLTTGVPAEQWVAKRDLQRAEFCLSMGEYEQADHYAREAQTTGLNRIQDAANELLGRVAQARSGTY